MTGILAVPVIFLLIMALCACSRTVNSEQDDAPIADSIVIVPDTVIPATPAPATSVSPAPATSVASIPVIPTSEAPATHAPATPVTPAAPVTSVTPETLATPDTFATPATPDTSVTPATPDTFATPAAPVTSATPDSLSLDSLQQSPDSFQLSPFTSPRPFMALRTNLLYDAALIPNIGLEVALGDHFSLAADWFYTWISFDQRHIYWQTYGGYLTFRYYFGKANAEQRLTGHHVGIYGTALTYDVEFGGIGYQAAKFGFGGGVEYGYSLNVARNLTLDFNLGVGYQGGEYKRYMPTDDGTGHYVWLSTHKRNWIGPTKAEISLKWLITPPEKKPKAEKIAEQITEKATEEETPENTPEETPEKKGGPQ